MATAEQLGLKTGDLVRYKGMAPLGHGTLRLVDYVGKMAASGKDGAVFLSSFPYTNDRVVTHIMDREGGIVPANSLNRPHLIREGEEFLHLVTADNPNLHPVTLLQRRRYICALTSSFLLGLIPRRYHAT